MALEARAGRQNLILVSRGRLEMFQGDHKVQKFRMGMLGSDTGVSVMG